MVLIPRVNLGWAYAVSGRKGEALKVLEQMTELSKRELVRPLDVANIYAALGDKTNAIVWLEKAAREDPGTFGYIRCIESFEPLRSDPRFQDLLRRMNFPR